MEVLWEALSFEQLLTEHPVSQRLVVPPEGGKGVDHAGKLPLAPQLLIQPVPS